MNTLLITLEYPPMVGGVSDYYSKLVKYWPEPNEIQVLDNSRGQLLWTWLPILKWLPAYFALRKKLSENSIDHLVVGQILPLGTVALWLSRKFNFRYSVVLHGMDLSFSLRQKRKKILSKKILVQADKIICANSYTRKLLIEAYGEELSEKAVVVNPGIENLELPEFDLIKKRKEMGLEDKFIILSIGRLVPRKGFDAVIQTLEQINDDGLRYIIAGAGPDDSRLRTMAKANVTFAGNISDEEKWQLLQFCDIFIMPSRNIDGDFEGFGIVYLEANLCGKPVIAGNSGGVADVVEDGVNGFLVDPEDTKSIRSAIERFRDDPALRRRLGETGRDRAIRKFDWSNQARIFHDAIKK